jgi:hypothetical protein
VKCSPALLLERPNPTQPRGARNLGAAPPTSMKNVRFLTSVSSVAGAYAGGELATLSDAQAEQWAIGGLVEIIAAPDAPAELSPAVNANTSPEAATHKPTRRARK